MDYMRKKYNLAIGERTAELIKIQIGSALPIKEKKEMDVRGRDLILGLPKTIKISTNEVVEAIADQLKEIIRAIKDVLQETPPELSADIIDRGIMLSGGTAMLKNMDNLVKQSTGVNCAVAEEPLFCVAKGAGIALESLDVYKRSVMTKGY